MVNAPPVAGRRPAATAHRWTGVVGLSLAGLIAVGVALRVVSRSELWLDEALSVNIASLPVGELLTALRHDGSPPLYYLILHGWIAVFGNGTEAVRVLSTCLSLATLPVVHRVGRLFGGRGTAQVLLVLVATNPFLIRYATETRMYALLVLLVASGLLVLRRAQLRPDLPRLVPVAVVSGLLMVTHYWAFFLLAAVGAVLLVGSVRGPGRSTARRLLAAEISGAVLFLPWIGGFRYQLAHTGTPWAPPPGWRDIVATLPVWVGGTTAVASLLAVVHLGAAALAVLPGRSVPGWWRRTRTATPWALLACSLGALVFAVLASRLVGAGYAVRYTAVFVPPMLLCVSLGLCRLRGRGGIATILVIALLGTGAAVAGTVTDRRTQAGDTATLLNGSVRPGDAVVYCPDQLGPAVSRLLPSDVAQFVYPTLGPPQRVDWVDYAQRNAAASPVRTAQEVARSVTGRIWLVTDSGYLTFGDDCESFATTLAALRGPATVLQHADGYFFENADVIRFPAPTGE